MTDGNDEKQEFKKRRDRRSIAIALSIVALMILFYLATILRLGGNVFDRPL